MAWLILMVAGILEVCWSLGLKSTNGFTNPVPSFFTILAIIASMYLLARATQSIPIGTAYAVWVGIGALGAALGGIFIFKEAVSFSKIFFLLLLIVSIVGLKISSDGN